MNFIKVGNQYVNFDLVESIQLENKAVCISYASGSAVWLTGEEATIFMLRIDDGLLLSPEYKMARQLVDAVSALGVIADKLGWLKNMTADL